MDSQPQHGQLITIHPKHAAEPILPALRAGVEHAIDFETLFAAALLYSIKGRHGDERFSTTPPAFTVLFWHGYFFVSRRARRYAWCFCPMSGCRARRPDVRHVGCQDERGACGLGHVIAVYSLFTACGCVPSGVQASWHHV